MSVELVPPRKSDGSQRLRVIVPQDRPKTPPPTVSARTATIMRTYKASDPQAASATPIQGGRPDLLASAEQTSRLTIALVFRDGRRAALPVERLEMPVDRFRWETAKASSGGEVMTVTGVKGDDIPIDAATLRYLVDPGYAEEVDAALEALQLSREELRKMAHDNPPPAAWYAQPQQDLTRESWK
jgi:hypothetical protein